MIDPTCLRPRFPALATDWALFDNAGGSAPLGTVIDAVREHMARSPVQLGASYPLSTLAAARVAAGRQAMARLVDAAPDEIVLGASSTALVRLLAQAIAPTLAAGDEIIVTNLDHESNIGAWRGLEERGIVVREWRFDPETIQLTRAGLDAVLTTRTRLVCFTHVANVVGAIHDARALVERIHDAGALACVDGVAFAPHRRVDVGALGADFYFASLYKVFGPHLGMLFARRDRLPRLRSQNHFFLGEDAWPYALEPGSVPHELASSLPAIVDHLLAIDAQAFGPSDHTERVRLGRAFDAIAAHESRLAAPLLDFLSSRRGVRVLGPATADAAARVATVAFTVDDREAGDIAVALEQDRVAIRSGHFYAWRAIEALGLHARGGVVRASFAHYNTAAEVDRLIRALDRVL